VSTDSKFQKDEISQLISKGRKQGYLLFEEIDKTFTEDLDSEEDFDDFLSSMGDYGIKILDSRQKEMTPQRRKSDLVSTHGLERTTDPVKLYLREMGNISLLTREGEIAIAREIERGEKSIIKALSRTRLVLNEVLALEDRIKDNPFVIQEMFEVSEDDIAEGKLEEKKKQVLSRIKKVRDLSKKLDRIPERKKTLVSRGRIIVRISRNIRDLNLRSAHREKIIDELRLRLKAINDLEDQRDEWLSACPRRERRTTPPSSRRSSRPAAACAGRRPRSGSIPSPCAGSSGPSRPARRSATRPRRSSSRPTSGWSSASPRSTATAASSSSTSSRKATWA